MSSKLGSCAQAWHGWYAMSTFLLALFFLFGFSSNFFYSFDVTRRFWHASFPQNLSPVQALLNQLPVSTNSSMTSSLIANPPIRHVPSAIASSGTITSQVAHACPQVLHVRCLLMAFLPVCLTCVTRPMLLDSWALQFGQFIKNQAVWLGNVPRRPPSPAKLSLRLI